MLQHKIYCIYNITKTRVSAFLPLNLAHAHREVWQPNSKLLLLGLCLRESKIYEWGLLSPTG